MCVVLPSSPSPQLYKDGGNADCRYLPPPPAIFCIGSCLTCSLSSAGTATRLPREFECVSASPSPRTDLTGEFFFRHFFFFQQHNELPFFCDPSNNRNPGALLVCMRPRNLAFEKRECIDTDDRDRKEADRVKCGSWQTGGESISEKPFHAQPIDRGRKERCNSTLNTRPYSTQLVSRTQTSVVPRATLPCATSTTLISPSFHADISCFWCRVVRRGWLAETLTRN